MHVHVRLGSSEAKLWLDPKVRVASSFGFDASTLRELVEVAQGNRALIERTSAPFRQNIYMKSRLLSPCVVATPRHSTSYGCGLRLA
jgi:hypothetical protein